MEEDLRGAAAQSAARVVVIVGVLLTAFAVLPLRGDWWWLGLGIGVVLLAAIVPVTFRRLRAVVVSARPLFEAIEAIVLLLAMLLVGFASVYYAMDHDHDQFTGLRTRVDAIYFTVTTLSTVGFGDISATGQRARVVVTVQMLFNVVFVGVLVRTFVAAARNRGRGRSRETDDSF